MYLFADRPPARATIDAGCDAGRVVSRRRPSREGCPAQLPGRGGRWRGESLLRLPGGGGTSNELEFCRHEWFPETARAEPDLEALRSAGLTRAAPDCDVVGPQESALDQAWREPFALAFAEQTGRSALAEHAATLRDALRAPVIVAVLDTVPRGQLHPRARHGLDVAALIESPACAGLTDDRCPLEVRQTLALPRTRSPSGALTIDTTRGGTLGTLGDVASSIHAAIEDWQRIAESASREGRAIPRLVINMSFGWRPELVHDGDAASPGPLFDADAPASVQAVHAALLEASCHGALLLAAAGNADDLLCPGVGPLAPAAWERLPAPDHARCRDLGVDMTPVRAERAATRPLVYAIGGTNHARVPFARSRAAGLPRLLAPAYHATADAGSGYAAPLTGTSAAVAVVSGLAATIWSLSPELDVNTLMERLYESARPLPNAPLADFGAPGSSRDELREVDLCRAVAAACDADATLDCPAVMSCDGSTDFESHLVDLWPGIEELTLNAPGVELAADAADDEVTQWTLASMARCDRRHERLSPQGDAWWSAAHEATSPDDWVHPQPSERPCRICDLDDDELHVLVSPNASESPMHAALVLATAASGSKLIELPDALLPDTMATYDALPIDPAWGSIIGAELWLLPVDGAGAPMVDAVFVEP
ncbi:MAG: S8 family serine peptidase [Myxococcales bacterium]|nr:S8 family serine peptidase [Myxococcales bacterium]